MRSKGNAPTAAQRRWRESVRELGSIVSGGDAIIHHCVGVTGSHNRVKIGHWWILPLNDWEHGELHNAIVIWEGFPVHSRKQFEKEAFDLVCIDLRGHRDSPPQEVIEAIVDYHL